MPDAEETLQNIAEQDHTSNQTNSQPLQSNLDKVVGEVHQRLLETVNLTEARRMEREQLNRQIDLRIEEMLTERREPLTAQERKTVIQRVFDEIFGLGPLEILLRQEDVTDICVNGPNVVYAERQGRMTRTDVRFRDEDHLMRIIERMANRVGRRIDESSPMLDSRLEDGTRVNAIIRPLSLAGPAISLRKFTQMPVDPERLIQLNTLTREMAQFLQGCVRCRANVVISGGTGSGKTTMLNVLSGSIESSERIITIEDTAELRLQQDHVVPLETRPPNIEGKGEIDQRDLLKNCLRMRPDRIIVGEVRGPEALDMLQAMNTGHEGSMGTIHANNTRDAIRRIEHMVTLSGLDIPSRTIRYNIGSALDLVIQVARLQGGRRRVMEVSEITGIEGENVLMQSIFQYEQKGIDSQGRAYGQFRACGVRPQILDRLKVRGIELPNSIFQDRVIGEDVKEE